MTNLTANRPMLTHDDLNVPGLCKDQRDTLRALVGEGPFLPREAAAAYIAAGHPWADIPRAYQALVKAGHLPDTGLIWRIARIAFREASKLERLRHLAPWAQDLGPDNWRKARDAAAAAADAAAAAAAARQRVRDEIAEMILAETERVLNEKSA